MLPPVNIEPQIRLRRMCSLGEANSALHFGPVAIEFFRHQLRQHR